MIRNLFKKILPFSSGSKHLIGIDLNNNNLKLCCLKSSGIRDEVLGMYAKNISGSTPQDISQIFLSFISRLNIKKPQVISIIPSSMLITKNIEVPSTDPHEINDIINLQAGRHTPYTREEIIVDHIVIGTYRNNYSKILLIIVTSAAVKKHFEALSKIGLKIERVLISAEGISWFATKLLKANSNNSAQSVLHIDSLSSEFMVIFKGKLVFMRSISMGIDSLAADPEKSRAKLAEEVKKSLEAYQSEDIEKIPASMIILGPSELPQGLETNLMEAVRIPIKRAGYLSEFSVSRQVLDSSFDEQSRNVSYLGVLAPLAASQELKVDLIPEEIRIKKQLEQRGRDLIKTGILVLMALIFTSVILAGKIYFKTRRYERLVDRYAPVIKEAQKLEKDYDKINLIRDYLMIRGFSMDVISELYTLSPIDMEFNDIRFDEEGRLTLRGSAESMSTVFSFVDTMEKSAFFKDVRVKYTTKRRQEKKDLTDFEINSSLEKAGDKK